MTGNDHQLAYERFKEVCGAPDKPDEYAAIQTLALVALRDPGFFVETCEERDEDVIYTDDLRRAAIHHKADNIVKAFVDHVLKKEPGEKIRGDDLYTYFRGWCVQNRTGHDLPESLNFHSFAQKCLDFQKTHSGLEYLNVCLDDNWKHLIQMANILKKYS